MVTQAAIQAKQPNFHTIKRRIFTMQHFFDFLIKQIEIQKKFLLFKNSLFLSFSNWNNFFLDLNSDIKKIKIMLHCKYLPL